MLGFDQTKALDQLHQSLMAALAQANLNLQSILEDYTINVEVTFKRKSDHEVS